MKKIVLILTQIISLLVIVFTIASLNSLPDGYELYVLLPLSYFIGSSFLYSLVLSKELKYPLSTYGILLMFFLRTVISPYASIASGWYVEAIYAPFINVNIALSIKLIAWECLLSLIFMSFIFRKDGTKLDNTDDYNDIRLKGNKLFYLLFIIFGIICFFLWGRELVSFGFLSSNEGERIGDNTNQFLNLVIQIIKISATFIFLLLMQKLQLKYSKNKKLKYALAGIFLAILNTSIIIGERRTIMLFTAVSSIYLVVVVFKKYKNLLVLIGGISAITLLGMFTFYKTFVANQFSSYSEALMNNDFSLEDLAHNLQAYFVGPHNVSISVLLSKTTELNFLNMIYDFFRSIFGLSFLASGLDSNLTSQVFNSIFYNSDNYQSGHILSSVGYGYIYFGFLMSPVFTLFHLTICRFFEGLLKKSKSFEGIYLWSYILSRIILNVYYSTPSMIVFITQNIATLGLAIFISLLISGKGAITLDCKEDNLFKKS